MAPEINTSIMRFFSFFIILTVHITVGDNALELYQTDFSLFSFKSDSSHKTNFRRQLTTSSVIVPTTQPTIRCGTNYSYIGCYKDGSPRTMEYQFSGVNYNPKTCLQAAVTSSYAYFSIQYGGECWASNTLVNAIEYGPSNQCNMKCNNPNPAYPGSCGGSLANALYSTGCKPIVIPLCNVTGNFIGNYVTLT